MAGREIMIEALAPIFARFRWFRRWAGGRWELWWVDSPVNDRLWHWRSVDDDLTHRPTCICRGVPIVEDYTIPEARVLTDEQKE